MPRSFGESISRDFLFSTVKRVPNFTIFTFEDHFLHIYFFAVKLCGKDSLKFRILETIFVADINFHFHRLSVIGKLFIRDYPVFVPTILSFARPEYI